MKYHALIHTIRKGFILAIGSTAMLAACGGDGEPDSSAATTTSPSSPSTPSKTAAEMCAGLENLEIPASAIGLPTTGGTVSSATLVASTETGNISGEYCNWTVPSSSGSSVPGFGQPQS
ncbi:hypothetical protein [Cupriavidus sp. YAF13]|uniref:hypothetical protein n=1 Tax=Cupriavidus sp. YAF13 TaxID=3233075 RepID=UPI003F8E3140